MPIYKDLLEKNVVVRSSDSGVWMGHLLSADGDAVLLRDARRIWSWQGAASCSGLALTGPSSGKIPGPVKLAVVHRCCEVLLATDEAVDRLSAIEEWK